MHWGMGIEAATLAGATVIGFLGLQFARHWQTPPTIFAVSGAIPMVPGVFAYEAMIGLLQVATTPTVEQAIVMDMVVNATKTGLILAAIAIGITAPGLLFKRRKPVV